MRAGCLAGQAAHPAPGRFPSLLAQSGRAALPQGDRQRQRLHGPTAQAVPHDNTLQTQWASVRRSFSGPTW